MSTISDEEILTQVAQGDEASFAIFYERHAPRLLGLATAILKNQREAEDVLQECFLYFWNKASQFDPERGKAFTWASLTVRHRAIDRLRQLVRQNPSQHAEKIKFEEESKAAKAPDEAAQLLERHAGAHNMLKVLPEDQRVLLGLAFFQGMSHGEISERLQQPLGTVKSLIRRALLRLRANFENSTEEDPR